MLRLVEPQSQEPFDTSGQDPYQPRSVALGERDSSSEVRSSSPAACRPLGLRQPQGPAQAGPCVLTQLLTILPAMNSDNQPKATPRMIDKTVGTIAFSGDMSLPSRISPATLPKP